ncbi:hypothetical protein Taro_045356 [Colocasia esculenta]|uniref:Glycosyltransferase N-terminal domain-containing protein n=1 Tax=Colocasia esculenta TaxID=4460 RepID=A0A843WWE0_COLES|nr:hypothetical protein [Colocasia esculenta]
MLAAQGMAVHFTGSPTHNRQTRVRLSGWDVGAFLNIRFHDLPVPRLSSPRPDTHAAVNSLSATSQRVVVFHDSLMSFAAQEAVAIPNSEAYVFHNVSAFANLLFQWAARGEDGWLRFVLPNCRRVPPVDGCFTEEFTGFIRRQYEKTPPPAGRLFNTCRSVEGKFVDLLARDQVFKHAKFFTVGPVCEDF